MKKINNTVNHFLNYNLEEKKIINYLIEKLSIEREKIRIVGK